MSGEDKKAGHYWPAFLIHPRRRALSIALTAALGCVVSTSCAQSATPTELTAHGVLLSVSQKTFTELESVQIRTDAGEILDFRVEGDTTLTPGHAREHMSMVDPVTVHYRFVGSDHVAFLITD